MDAVLAYIGGWSVAGIICLVVGLALMIAEMFTPGMGLMGALGICSIIAAIILRKRADNACDNTRFAVCGGNYSVSLLPEGAHSQFRNNT